MEHGNNYPNLKNKFYQKIANTRVSKKFITIPSTLETMQQLIIEPWRRPQVLLPEKIQKLKKCKNFKKFLKFVILKS